MDEKTPITVELLPDDTYRKSRLLMAAILTMTRCSKRQRPLGVQLEQRLAKLPPLVICWHWQAWSMGGFTHRLGTQLGTTPDGMVAVVAAREVLIGNPMTEDIVTVARPTPPATGEPTYVDPYGAKPPSLH